MLCAFDCCNCCTASFFVGVLFATIEDPYNVLCWFCVVYGVVYIIFFLRKGDNGAEPWTATFMMLWMLLTHSARFY